jgi:hypothetical protein
MHFTTKVPLPKSKNPIDYNSKIMSLGSCFAVNMAEKFDYYKFQNTCNPFGIIFNSVSIEKLVDRAVNKHSFTEKDIFFHNNLWHCFEVHSELSNPDKEALLKHLNTLIDAFYFQIATLTHCVITYGTSWIYRNRASNSIVANCHKVPQTAFSKEILSVEAISNSIQNTIGNIQKINPDCKIIFTVSPVRHLKDGFVENQQSKAHLIAAIHSTHNSQLTTHNYFPSYEIMMDELRDYRFYAEDMIHPSPIAIDYIWERFAETNISPESHSVMEEVATIQKGLAHRPFNPNSVSHQLFLSKLQDKISILQTDFPQIQF